MLKVIVRAVQDTRFRGVVLEPLGGNIGACCNACVISWIVVIDSWANKHAQPKRCICIVSNRSVAKLYALPSTVVAKPARLA